MTSVEQRRLGYADLERMGREELFAITQEFSIELPPHVRRKQDMIYRILEAQTAQEGQIFRAGVLEILDEGGYGFLRGENYLASMSDVYVSQSQVRRFGLRTG